MNLSKLIYNALLAGLWAFLAALQASGEWGSAALWAAGTVAVRAVIGYLAAHFNHPVSVDS